MIARVCLLTVAVVAGAGCAPVRMARECEKLSKIVDSGQRDLERAVRPNDAAAYRTAGALYKKIAVALRGAASSSRLRTPAEDHARSIEAMGPSVTAYAEALESGDTALIEAAHSELGRASRREQMASRRLATECQGRF